MIRKTLTILAVSCMMYSCGTKTESNPFFTEFQTEYGVPSFDKIKLEHYEPAFLKGIEEQNQNIQAIIASPEVPTFDNTIVALDSSAPILDRVSAIFFNMTDAETTDELTELSIKMAPVLSEHEDNISLNQELFKRVNVVYQQKDSMNLTTEQKRLLDKTYKGFVRSGANLDAEKQARLREINKELSTLGITFSNNILNENNAFQLFVDKKEDLAGLPEWFCQSAAEEAKAAGQPGKWLFTLHNAFRSCNTLRTALSVRKCTKHTSTAAITMTRMTTKKRSARSSPSAWKKQGYWASTTTPTSYWMRQCQRMTAT